MPELVESSDDEEPQKDTEITEVDSEASEDELKMDDFIEILKKRADVPSPSPWRRRRQNKNKQLDKAVKVVKADETAAESLDRDRDEGVIADSSSYKYLEDYGPTGPEAQWELLKHALNKDYEPTEEVYEAATRRALETGRRRDVREERLKKEKGKSGAKLCPITEARGQEPAFAAAAK